MYYGRILALLGVVAAVAGFLLQKASSAGEQAMAALNQANPAIPPSLDENTWSALYNDTAWAAIVYAIATVAALVVVFTPPLKEPMKRLYGLTASTPGVLMLIIGIFATMGAMDDADTLEAGFAQAFSAGAIPEAYTVSIGWGLYLLILAGVLVAIGGVVSLLNRPDESAVS
jgi:hypothetical protein